MTEFGEFVFFSSNRIFAGCGKRAAAKVFAIENIGEEVKFSCIRATAALPFGGKCDYLLTTFFVVVKIAGNDILIPPLFGT